MAMIEHAQESVSDTGMELRDLLKDADFPRRKRVRSEAHAADAYRALAHVFAETPDVILQNLVDMATAFCGADSAGISLEEADEKGERKFRWVAISGSFARFLGGTTPRFFSPCGTTLDCGRAQLYRVNQAYYDYLGIEAEPITDGILIPWETGELRGTIWCVSHRDREAFDAEDFRLLTGLADFAAIAIRNRFQQEKLQEQARSLAAAYMANELAHQINNPLQSVTNALYLAERGGGDTQAFVNCAVRELARVARIVNELLALSPSTQQQVVTHRKAKAS